MVHLGQKVEVNEVFDESLIPDTDELAGEWWDKADEPTERAYLSNFCSICGTSPCQADMGHCAHGFDVREAMNKCKECQDQYFASAGRGWHGDDLY